MDEIEAGRVIPRILDLARTTPLAYRDILAAWDRMERMARRAIGGPLDAFEDATLWTACERFVLGCGRHGFNPAVMIEGIASLSPVVTIAEWAQIAAGFDGGKKRSAG